MMGNLVIADLTEGEKLAFLACLFISGDMTSNEYVTQVEQSSPVTDRSTV